MIGAIPSSHLQFGELKLPAGADSRVVELLGRVREQLSSSAWMTSEEYRRMKKVRDQVKGGAKALCQTYHPDIPGLNAEQQQKVRLARKHVNLARPALNRLVNAIHSGRVTRRARQDEAVQRLVRRRRHAMTMGKLCELAFGYGTGFVVPILREGRLKYWLPNPLWTVPIVDPLDCHKLDGLVELVRDRLDTKTIGMRFVGPEVEGWFLHEKPDQMTVAEHGLGFCPAVGAYGIDQRHLGEPLGLSLVEEAADGSIRVTNNELNVELMRDRLTQALLLIYGQPTNSTAEMRETLNKFLAFNRVDDGKAEFIVPDSRLESVLLVTERLCADTAVGTELPVDTFLPEKVTGSDASAASARIRSFPLIQRMVRLNLEWVEVEERVAALVGALLRPSLVAGERDFDAVVEELVEELGIEVSVQMSLPEAESETLSNWQQRTANFFAPVEEAIEYYSGDKDEATKAKLAALWRQKHEKGSSEAEDEALKWKREIVKALFGDATTGDVMANLSDLRRLLDEAGIARQEGYEEPWLPVRDDAGELVGGGVLKDEEGDVVGGLPVEDGGEGEGNEEGEGEAMIREGDEEHEDTKGEQGEEGEEGEEDEGVDTKARGDAKGGTEGTKGEESGEGEDQGEGEGQ